MAFRAIHDRETGELVIEYDARADKLRYVNGEGQTRVRSLHDIRRAVKEEQRASGQQEARRAR